MDNNKNAFKYYQKELKAELSYFKLNFGWLLSKKKKAIYIGCTVRTNVGDLAVLNSIKSLTNDRIFIYPISYSKPSSGKFLRKFFIKNVDYIFLGGGTIIKKSKNEGYLKLFREYSEIYPKASLNVIGTGVSDPELSEKFGFPTNKKDWAETLNQCSHIFVRGLISKKYLENWGIEKSIKIFHDPAIHFRKEKIHIKPQVKKIGINFCNILGRIYGQDQKMVENFARDIVSRLMQEGWDIYLLATAWDDISYMKKIFNSQTLNQINIIEYNSNLDDTLSIFDDLDVFIGQRLHSVIFSAITYTPFIALEYESKTSDFLKTLSLDKYSFRTDDLDLEKTYSLLLEIYQESKNIQIDLYNKIKIANKEQNQLIKSI